MPKSRAIDTDIWADRYLEWQGTPEYKRRIEEDAEMLTTLGAVWFGFSPGASIGTPGGDDRQGCARLDTAAWNWLRPLLAELIRLREVCWTMDLHNAGADSEHR